MLAAVRSVWGGFTSREREPEPVLQASLGIEGRTAPRHEVDVAGTIWLAGAEHPCVIQNVSTGGMTVSAPTAAVCTGQQVIVDTEQMGSLYGIIRWFRDGNFGVQFQKPMALDVLNHMREATPKGMKPRAGRARVSMPAVVHYGTLSRQVEVGNIAAGGLMMATRLPMRPAQSVMIELRDMLPIGGHIRWAEAGRCGVMFTKLLPISAALEIARRGNLPEAWVNEIREAHGQGQTTV